MADANFDYDKYEEQMREWNRTNIVGRAASELQGMAATIIYDGVVDNEEIKLLYGWLTLYEPESCEWPMNQLRELIESICEDGIVTSAERAILLRFLKDFAVGPDEKPVVEGIYDDVTVIIPEHTFLFTGKLCFGPRKKAQDAVVKHGGKLARSKSVTQDLNYLVCGDLGSPNYRQSRYGNKIAKAIDCRDEKGTGLLIVTEESFVSGLIAPM